MNLSAAVKPIIFESHRGCWCYCWYFGFKKLEPISRSVVFATGRVFGMKNSRKTIFMMRFINFDTEVVNLSSLFPLSIWQLFFFPFLVVEKWKNECRPSFLQSTRTTHTQLSPEAWGKKIQYKTSAWISTSTLSKLKAFSSLHSKKYSCWTEKIDYHM